MTRVQITRQPNGTTHIDIDGEQQTQVLAWSVGQASRQEPILLKIDRHISGCEVCTKYMPIHSLSIIDLFGAAA